MLKYSSRELIYNDTPEIATGKTKINSWINSKK